MQETKTYKKQSRIFLAQAFEELKKGDLPQASEKGWGAAAQMVKANAQEMGWRHFSHRDIMRAVSALTDETSDEELANLFALASHLHVNFYENALSNRIIGSHLRQVERFVDKAEGILGETP